MALDPRIPLGVQAPQVQNPLEVLSAIAQIQGVRDQAEARRLAADEARQKAKDTAELRQVLTETGGDLDAAIPRLMAINPAIALKLQTDRETAKKEKYAALKNQMDFRTEGVKFGANIASLVDSPEKAQAVRPYLQGLSDELKPLIPQSDDPAEWRQFGQLLLTSKERFDQSRADLDLLDKGHVVEAVASSLSRATSQEELDGKLAGFRELHVPKAILAQFGTTWSPTYGAEAAQLGITPEKRETIAGQTAARAQTAAHQAVIEAQGAQRIAIARQRLAKGTGTERDRSDLIDAVVNNPGLWDQITPTERGKIAGDLQRRGFTGFGKPLSDGAIKLISESEAAVASLKDLRGVLERNEQYIGPIAGLQALNPYSKAREAQADIDRVRQRVGKTLEGGVLRKEDEEKYKKQLAAITDEPSTALYKVDRIMQDIARDIENYKHNQRLAGRRVPQSETPAAAAVAAHKVGDIVTVKGQKVRITKLLPGGKYEGVSVP